jgi:hypothetical protein
MPCVGSSSSSSSGSSASVVASSSAPFASVRQLDRRACFVRRELDRGEQLACARIQCTERALGAPELERVGELALQSDTHVLEHAHVRERGGDLERAHHAATSDLRGTLRGDLFAFEPDRSRR